jgi:hypothetical protein
MSTIAEFYSRNLATEVAKGMTRKPSVAARTGARPSATSTSASATSSAAKSAPSSSTPNGAPMIEWAFKAYASGNWSVSQLHDELTSRGLRSLPTPKRPAKPLAVSTVHRLLTNPYYKGDVVYRGTRYKGNHPALVPAEVWYQVQSVLTAHQCAVEATQVHGHYLKGTIHCGQCGSRLIVSNAKNRHGNVYCYFVCSGRHSKRTDCTRQAMLIEDVEKLVEDYYTRVQITPAQQDALAGMLHHEFDRLMAAETEELARLTTNRDRLESEQDRLMQAHYADAIPLTVLKREQDRILAELDQGDPPHRRPLRRLRRRPRPPRRRPRAARQLRRHLRPLRRHQPAAVQPGVLHQGLHRRGQRAARRAQPALRDAPRPPGQRQRSHLGRRHEQGPNPRQRFRWQGFEPCAVDTHTLGRVQMWTQMDTLRLSSDTYPTRQVDSPGMGKRSFGQITRLPSKRYRARYTDPRGAVRPHATKADQAVPVIHTAPTTFDTREDAEAWLTDERRLISGGKWIPPAERAEAARRAREARKARIFEDYARAWLDGKHDLKAATRTSYETSLRVHLNPNFGRLPVDEITPEAVRAWFSSYGDKTPTARAHAYAVLAAVMTQALDDELITRNPCRIKKGAKSKVKREPEVLTLAELLALADAMRPADDAPPTGARNFLRRTPERDRSYRTPDNPTPSATPGLPPSRPRDSGPHARTLTPSGQPSPPRPPCARFVWF